MVVVKLSSSPADNGAQFGALRYDLGCNLDHDLSHNLGMIWATVNAPIFNMKAVLHIRGNYQSV